MSDKAILTCALTGVLTDPTQHHVPVTPEQMAAEAKAAYDEGATIMHCHYRQQTPGKGHLPSWDGALAHEINDAIRAACPGVVINMTTGVVGRDQTEVLKYLAFNKPEMAAMNAGSLNYLKTRKDGSWAWPPMVFDNPVEKVAEMLAVMKANDIIPEFECFDVGIVRSVGLYLENGMVGHADYNFVMGVASGMPCDADLLPLLIKYKHPDSPWQATLIGRQNVWPVHQRVAELGGNLRTGLEDCFYLPSGDKATSNGPMIAALARCARNAGREVTSPEETRTMIAKMAWS
ncbi:3-keto-5-aminohexanoate cleavage protein [Kordiimonas marina]|uniref:3-keto-5-aminohexanoate cleavage protein n=1 Tax=Kordiimonas marina TaxID=2872312 RepID=UPI001FF48FA9|nr:3-keto-5-aminohexanoate cleavage protein [Kordiimonas marina]MCJ9427737.1 3-keto-5-aminohexanoate cleavage protein [Kordiimonas marina]